MLIAYGRIKFIDILADEYIYQETFLMSIKCPLITKWRIDK